MNYKDINKGNWSISSDLEIDYNGIKNLSKAEQETHILHTDELDMFQVTTSEMRYMTKCFKSGYFTLEKVLLSKHCNNKDFVLELSGSLRLGGLTIRSKVLQPNMKTIAKMNSIKKEKHIKKRSEVKDNE